MHSPIVIVPACTKQLGHHPYHTVQMKYVDAVLTAAQCMPLILPAFGERTDWDAIVSCADGIMLTGSPSNVHPSHFEQEVHNPELPLDPARDATTLPLIRLAIEYGIPLFAICRGFQEINVALGGSLHQAVQEVPGKMDHREAKELSLEQQYAPAHEVAITAGKKLAAILGPQRRTIQVNSLHGQGINRLADGLSVEAVAPDGIIEAYSVDQARHFALAVQWHPEWRVRENPDSMEIFEAFGRACRDYREEREPRQTQNHSVIRGAGN
ncbi:MAG: gamma-glutamyl-gamma-aminobutyrate hydrolase family protein [Burkholderiales bacterium]|nr:gamma-glutamyl-gamma-aminobutyrate hydrolase family protein [Burkholderiales bacterium]